MQNRLTAFLKFGWIPLFVFLFEIPWFLWLQDGESQSLVRFSILISALSLLAGWLPLILQPSTQARQAAIFATLLASVLLLPPPIQTMNQAMLLPLEQFSILQLWRVFNSMAMLPSALHLVAIIAGNQRFLNHKILIPLYLSPIFWMINVFTVRDEYALWFLRQIILLWMLGLMVGIIWILIQGVRRQVKTSLYQAQQLRSLLLLGMVILIPVFLRFIGLFMNITLISYEWFLFSMLLLPLGVGTIILRHNLFEIDGLIRRAVGSTTISIVASLLFFLLVIATGNRIGDRIPQYRWGSIFIALLFLAIIFTPLQRWLQKKIDLWFYPERYNFPLNLQGVQQSITRVIDPAEIMRWLTCELPERIGAEWAIWVPGEIPSIPQIAIQQQSWSTLFMVGDIILGGFWLGMRKSNLPYTHEEQQQLEQLCQQAALALAYAQALATVEANNLDLEKRVAERSAQVLEKNQSLAILAERRRIARDLHDSISQTLFSINLGARAIRKMADKDPISAMEELFVLERSAQTAQQEMRSLMNELREPPRSENSGTINLVPLLKAHFDSLSQQPGMDGHPPLLRVTYIGPDTIWLSSDVVDTVIFVCREALHNVIKHAWVRQATVQLQRTLQMLTIIVKDEGKGFSGEIRADAMGMENMRLRLAQHGGSYNAELSPGIGSTLRFDIPMEENP